MGHFPSSSPLDCQLQLRMKHQSFVGRNAEGYLAVCVIYRGPGRKLISTDSREFLTARKEWAVDSENQGEKTEKRKHEDAAE